eukprot:10649095-Heterocapsa_arctica.AAC.1
MERIRSKRGGAKEVNCSGKGSQWKCLGPWIPQHAERNAQEHQEGRSPQRKGAGSGGGAGD